MLLSEETSLRETWLKNSPGTVSRSGHIIISSTSNSIVIHQVSRTLINYQSIVTYSSPTAAVANYDGRKRRRTADTFDMSLRRDWSQFRSRWIQHSKSSCQLSIHQSHFNSWNTTSMIIAALLLFHSFTYSSAAVCYLSYKFFLFRRVVVSHYEGEGGGSKQWPCFGHTVKVMDTWGSVNCHTKVYLMRSLLCFLVHSGIRCAI